ncbi:MAG: nucleotide disphospho-sugar-binding domain-containing protein [Burkholderiaceae bacterium]
MARYLFAWELGGDYGHLARLLPVALALRARGHDVVFAVRDLMGAETLIQPHGITSYQAPLWLRQVTRLPDPISYPELLMRFGYLNATALTGVCRAWRNLIDLLQPQVVVLDHAPTALLATRGMALARINFGDGFCIPPVSQPMPHFRWWQPENTARLRDSEQHALANANQVLQSLGAPPLASMGELRACDATLMCTFAELDHYPQREPQEYLGPIFALGASADPAWPAAGGPRIFAYLKPGHGLLDTMLEALHKSSARALVHIPGATRQTLTRFDHGNVRLSTAPLPIERMARECDLALCHGGAGTTAALLLAGKPMLLVPTQVEQAMTAHRMAAMGAAKVVTPELELHFPKMLASAIGNTTMSAAAQAFALAHPSYDQMVTINTAADRCEAVLRGAK